MGRSGAWHLILWITLVSSLPLTGENDGATEDKDTVPPVTTLTEKPGSPTLERTALFRFTASEPVLRYECRLDDELWHRCTGEERYEALSEGRHTFTVRATDRAGNVEVKPVVFEWDIPYQFVHVSTGYQHTCAVNAGGKPSCWGNNNAQQLGVSERQESFYPVEPRNLVAWWRKVSAGRFHTCGIGGKDRADQRLYCWGSNGSGQLGTGDERSGFVPIEVAGGHNDWEQMTAGISNTCGIRTDGGKRTLYCWGENGAGQSGDPSYQRVLSPRPVADDLRGWRYVSGGFSHNCGLREDGGEKRVYCWGANGDGQLGDGSAEKRRVEPVEVSGGYVDWGSVSAGYYHTCGIREEQGARRIYCWGSAGSGQLGTGDTARRTTPTPIAGDNDSWLSLTAGANHTCAIRQEGEGRAIYCWGDNRYGQSGLGRVDRVAVPQKVKSDYADWQQMSAGETHTCAIREHKKRGILYCWGRNQFGQLGDGTDETRETPVEITGMEQKKEAPSAKKTDSYPF